MQSTSVSACLYVHLTASISENQKLTNIQKIISACCVCLCGLVLLWQHAVYFCIFLHIMVKHRQHEKGQKRITAYQNYRL